MVDHTPTAPPARSTLDSFIFLSRWLEAPLYSGLIDRVTFRTAEAH